MSKYKFRIIAIVAIIAIAGISIDIILQMLIMIPSALGAVLATAFIMLIFILCIGLFYYCSAQDTEDYERRS